VLTQQVSECQPVAAAFVAGVWQPGPEAAACPQGNLAAVQVHTLYSTKWVLRVLYGLNQSQHLSPTLTPQRMPLWDVRGRLDQSHCVTSFKPTRSCHKPCQPRNEWCCERCAS
jgi:hypothetical protein